MKDLPEWVKSKEDYAKWKRGQGRAVLLRVMFYIQFALFVFAMRNRLRR